MLGFVRLYLKSLAYILFPRWGVISLAGALIIPFGVMNFLYAQKTLFTYSITVIFFNLVGLNL